MEKKFLSEMKDGVVNQTWWPYDFAGSTRNAGAELKEIFDGRKVFDTPKPKALVRRIIELATQKNDLILDSFAGSGTTAHAVLEANKIDGGSRRFILIEMEEYADGLTAERVRRVINGYAFAGTQRTELMREKITWEKVKKAHKIVEKVEAFESLYSHEYDRIRPKVKDDLLVVTGERVSTDRVEGLGGAFTYCTLGDPIELDRLLTGEALPHYGGIAAALFHMATNCALNPEEVREAEGYLGEAGGRHVWLFYKPDLDWLKSADAALTLTRARTVASMDTKKRHLVFAPARYVSQKMLTDEGIPVEFAPLPFALYRVDRS